MQKFEFSLESAMQYRQMQIDLQKGKLESLYAELRRLNAEEQGLRDEKEFADALVKGVDPAYSLSLMALDNFTKHVSVQQEHLEGKRAACFKEIARQQSELMDIQRSFQLLERLREKKLAEWRRANDHEQEQIATDTHLARLVRDAALCTVS